MKVKSVSHWVASDCLRAHVCSPPDSFLYGMFQARIVEWAAIPFCSGSSLPRDWTHVFYVSCTGSLPLAPPGPSYEVSIWLLLMLSHFSHVQLCATPQTAAHQAPPSLGFSRQEHWSGLPFPPPMHGSEKWKSSCSVVFDSLWPHGLQPTRLLHPWEFGLIHTCLA